MCEQKNEQKPAAFVRLFDPRAGVSGQANKRTAAYKAVRLFAVRGKVGLSKQGEQSGVLA